MGAESHIHQLEGAELHNCPMLFFHLGNRGKQGRANIAAQPNGLAIGLQNFRNQGGGSGLAVRAGNCQQITGAKFKEHLHFAGDLSTAFPKFFQCRDIRVHTGGAKNKISTKIFQIVIPHFQGTIQSFQLQYFCIQLFSGGAITTGDRTAIGQKQTDKGAIAHTQTHHKYIFPFQRLKIGIKSHFHKHSSQVIVTYSIAFVSHFCNTFCLLPYGLCITATFIALLDRQQQKNCPYLGE